MSNSSVSGPKRVALLLLMAAVFVSSAGSARAQMVDCSTLMNPVYVGGSSAAAAFLKFIAVELSKQTPPITVITESKASGSCSGVGFFADPQAAGTISGTGTYWAQSPDAPPLQCNLTGNVVDIGISDVWPSTCPGGLALPANVKDTYGPVQTMTFVVPMASNQSIISAEAAYLVFGLGADGGVSPWTDESFFQIRNSGSGTQQMIAANIKLPAAKFLGDTMRNTGGGAVLNNLIMAADPEKAIGILATDVADQNAGKIKVLGYQHYGQSCAYWPGSISTSFDKANVRDGHYPIAGPMHLLAKVEGGAIANANAKKVVDMLSGAVDPTGFDLIDREANGGVVPICAMKVTRTADGGPMASFQPDKDCTCKFLSAFGPPPSECKPCAMDSDCTGARTHCNYKFCEVK